MNKDVLIAGSLALGCVILISLAFILPSNKKDPTKIVSSDNGWSEKIVIDSNRYQIVLITDPNGKKFLLSDNVRGVSLIEYHEK